MRLFIQELLIFLSPSLCFVFFLLITKRDPRHKVHWNGKAVALFIVGSLLASVAFLYEGMVAPRDTGAYVPAHTEKGVLVPGYFK